MLAMEPTMGTLNHMGHILVLILQGEMKDADINAPSC